MLPKLLAASKNSSSAAASTARMARNSRRERRVRGSHCDANSGEGGGREPRKRRARRRRHLLFPLLGLGSILVKNKARHDSALIPLHSRMTAPAESHIRCNPCLFTWKSSCCLPNRQPVLCSRCERLAPLPFPANGNTGAKTGLRLQGRWIRLHPRC